MAQFAQVFVYGYALVSAAAIAAGLYMTITYKHGRK